MPYVIQIITRVDDKPTPYDNQYVVAYDPTYCPPGREYDGGLLTTTTDLSQAMKFDTHDRAFEKWRESYGTRPWDGRPNRPLTAFHVRIMHVVAIEPSDIQ